uniref:AAA+ ATPase domain-containing protein n=1 Tax=viral metagenome TaxID=1070528 RepID=A0A6C0CAG9_9ZZZZ
MIDDIISHEMIIRSLKNFIMNKTLPHMLFFGLSGTGKTSTIMCCAREIYGEYEDCMVLRLNASNERGIETVRVKIKSFVSNRNSIFFKPEIVKQKDTPNMFKLVILDEIDSMTVEAQGMLRQSIEKNSSSTRFCLICNNIDKINPALRSRCAPFHFMPLRAQDMKKRLGEIKKIEKISCANDVLDIIVTLSKGDMRNAITILQSTKSFGKKDVTIDDIYKISGYCLPSIIQNVYDILIKLMNGDAKLFETVNLIVNIICDNNITIFNLLDELKNFVMNSKISATKKIFLIDNFAKNEEYDSVNVDQKNIIMNISSLFVLVNKN